jgi:hypothetical protein
MRRHIADSRASTKIDSRTGVVAPPIRQPAVHVCRRSRRPTANVAVN